MKRRIAAAVLAVIMTLSMTACGSGQTAATENTGEAAEEEIAADISLWTFPVGSWGDAAAVEQIISGFNREYPKIRVSVEYLDYAEGDNKIQTARAEGKGPDIILEGPERLVSWGFSGWMADLNDLWDDKTVKDVADNNLAVLAACISPDGNYYEYPLYERTLHGSE